MSAKLKFCHKSYIEKIQIWTMGDVTSLCIIDKFGHLTCLHLTESHQLSQWQTSVPLDQNFILNLESESKAIQINEKMCLFKVCLFQNLELDWVVMMMAKLRWLRMSASPLAGEWYSSLSWWSFSELDRTVFGLFYDVYSIWVIVPK